MLKIKRNKQSKESSPQFDEKDPLGTFIGRSAETVEAEPTSKPEQKKPKEKADKKLLLNHADYLKMQTVTRISLFLLVAFLYFLIVLVTVSGMEISSIHLTSDVLAKIHFVAYVIFVVSLARMITSFGYFLGQKYFSHDGLGIAIHTLTLLAIIVLFVQHFQLLFLFEKLITYIPF